MVHTESNTIYYTRPAETWVIEVYDIEIGDRQLSTTPDTRDSEGTTFWGLLAVHGDTLYAPGGYSVVAFDRQNGEELWSHRVSM